MPHNGALCRNEDNYETNFMIAIRAEGINLHVLEFTRSDISFAQRLFSILDTESRGLVGRTKVREFATQRCPVFWRRDDDLRKLCLTSASNRESNCGDASIESPTFCEIWDSVVACSSTPVDCESKYCELGLEGWMVFCRFIALAQYLEAKRRFSARHSQQTMRHRNSPRGSELVFVNVPPPEPPAPLTPEQLAMHERRSQSPLPLPELDLDHSLLAAHDSMRRPLGENRGRVKIELFGYPQGSGSNLEFAVTFARSQKTNGVEQTVVRRNMADMKWLDDTVTSHKALGGTLCGRILPPFPPSGNRMLLATFNAEDSLLNSSIKSTTGGAIAVAAAGVVKIKSVAKSLFGSYLDFTTQSKSGSSHGAGSNTSKSPPQKKKTKHSASAKTLPESFYNPHSPSGKARQIERYLNYLLDHPALSTSFPLNAILTASQSGLEAAKRSIEECNKAAKELREQTPQLDDGGKLFVPLWSSSSDSSYAPNFAWVRTAAQAAMALRVHGMLETTGMPSASARLQHASLPSFGKAKHGTLWEDDAAGEQSRRVQTDKELVVDNEGQNFEDGVICVQSELKSEDQFDQKDDGYDLLPLPVPAPERRILTVGNSSSSTSAKLDSRFHYGSMTEVDLLSFESNDDDTRSVVLGNMLVDDNIDKLREVIGSVENTLSRCLGSSGSVGTARRERLKTQIDVIRGLDSWDGMRGQFVSQRALLRGIGGMSQSREIYEESDLILVDDLSWQASLARSAVGAAEDVRSVIRASRTAANAKAAANSAAMSAEQACNSGDFSTMEEARAAQTRSSIAQSHAIHAAVVDHEAKAVKRRATLALAHDVKCWNVHRKSQLLQCCLSYARSQHEATRRAVDAWSTLRDGFIGTPLILSAHDRRTPPTPTSRRPKNGDEGVSLDSDEVVATIFASPESSGEPLIVATEHPLLSVSTSPTTLDEDTNWAELPLEAGQQKSPIDPDSTPEKDMPVEKDALVDKVMDFCDSNLILPFATASLIQEEPREARESLHNSNLSKTESKGEEKLSVSMQSLVDGLMAWGGGFDVDEDHMALPPGMAASIALEESGSMSASKLFT